MERVLELFVKIIFFHIGGCFSGGTFHVFVWQLLSIHRKRHGTQSCQNVSPFTFLTCSSGLLLYKNSNKQNIPQVGFIEIIWRTKQLFNLPQFGYFSLPFPFQVGKARSWEKWLLGPRHSQGPQRLPGGLMVSSGTHVTVNFLSPYLSICHWSPMRWSLQLQLKKQFAGKSWPLSNTVQSSRDWLAVDWKTLHFHV